jgi:hypothetical protein
MFTNWFAAGIQLYENVGPAFESSVTLLPSTSVEGHVDIFNILNRYLNLPGVREKWGHLDDSVNKHVPFQDRNRNTVPGYCSSRTVFWAVEVDATGLPVLTDNGATRVGLVFLSMGGWENIVSQLAARVNPVMGHRNLTGDELGGIYLYGDVTNPKTGLIARGGMSQAKVGQAKTLTFGQWNPLSPTQAGAVPSPIPDEVLSKRQPLTDGYGSLNCQLFNVYSAAEIVAWMMSESWLPYDFVAGAVEEFDLAIDVPTPTKKPPSSVLSPDYPPVQKQPAVWVGASMSKDKLVQPVAKAATPEPPAAPTPPPVPAAPKPALVYWAFLNNAVVKIEGAEAFANAVIVDGSIKEDTQSMVDGGQWTTAKALFPDLFAPKTPAPPPAPVQPAPPPTQPAPPAAPVAPVQPTPPQSTAPEAPAAPAPSGAAAPAAQGTAEGWPLSGNETYGIDPDFELTDEWINTHPKADEVRAALAHVRGNMLARVRPDAPVKLRQNLEWLAVCLTKNTLSGVTTQQMKALYAILNQRIVTAQ